MTSMVKCYWLCWGLTTRQPLWVILCRPPEKGRKEIVEDERDGQGRKRKINESEETEEIKTFPFYPYCYKVMCYWLCWGLTTRQPLWVILCRTPEKGRKEIVEDERDRQGRKRKINESEETEEIKTFPFYPYCYKVMLLIVLGFNDMSTLVGHFVSSPREREKTEEKVEKERRGGGGGGRRRERGNRKMNESEETEEIKTFLFYPYLLQG